MIEGARGFELRPAVVAQSLDVIDVEGEDGPVTEDDPSGHIVRRDTCPTCRALDEAELVGATHDFRIRIAEHAVERPPLSTERSKLARLGAKSAVAVAEVDRDLLAGLGWRGGRETHQPGLVVATE